MQLQMTAPLDIGLEQTDATLGLGQDDMFDLGRTDGPKTNNNATFAMDDDGDAVLESSDEDSVDGADDDAGQHCAVRVDVQKHKCVAVNGGGLVVSS